MPRASNIKRFFSLIMVCLWFFTAPMTGYATGGDFISQLDEMELPVAHKIYIRQFLFERESQCLSHGIDFEIEVDPDAIYTLVIAEDGTRATVFHVVLNCSGKGNLWSSTSGTQSFILVGDQIFENWLMAPPRRLFVDNKLSLLLSLDSSQCSFLSDKLSYSSVETCYSILRWIPEAGSFHGVGIR